MEAAAMKKKRIHLRRDLPDGIIQHIQFYLPEKDAVRSSLLSKSWQHAQSTLPWLRFHQSRFGLPMVFQYHKPEDSLETKHLRQRFFKFVDDTLVRYNDSSLLVEKFDLSVEIAAGSELGSHVERWLRLVSQRGLKHLSLTALTNDNICTIPFEIFSSDALRTLKIWVQGHGEPLRCPCINPRIGCFSLQVLELRWVHISEELIGELVSNCPLLEEITLRYCNGFGRIQARDLHRLRVFDISGLNGEIVEIDAPSLRSFTYRGDEAGQRLCRFNIDASTSLTCLRLHGVQMEKRSFENFISKFPLLEKLSIRSNFALVGIDIACPKLIQLSISYCMYLQDIKVNAPKLVHFDYLGKPNPSFDFPGVDAGQLKANIMLQGRGFARNSCFLWLSKALQISRNLSIQLNIADVDVIETNLVYLRGNDMLPSKNVEGLFLWLTSSPRDSTNFSTIMDAFFTFCHPRYIKTYRIDKQFCNFLLVELMDRRTLNACNSIRSVEVSLMCSADVAEDEKSSLVYSADDDKDETKLLKVPWRNLIDGSATYKEYEYIRFTIDWSS